VAVGGGADLYAGAARSRNTVLICLGELNAPKSCWSVLGTRQRSACREEFGPSLKTPLAIQSCCHLSKGDIWGPVIVLDFKAAFFSFGEETKKLKLTPWALYNCFLWVF